MIDAKQQKRISEKFFNDPDWALVEQMIVQYLEPLTGVDSVDTKRTNDEIATDVRARQLAIENLGKFLKDCRILRKQINNKVTTFK